MRVCVFVLSCAWAHLLRTLTFVRCLLFIIINSFHYRTIHKASKKAKHFTEAKNWIDGSIKLEYKDGYNFGVVHVAHYNNRGPNEWSAKCNTVPNKTNKFIARIRRKRAIRKYKHLCILLRQNAVHEIRVHFTYQKREHFPINSYSLLS